MIATRIRRPCTLHHWQQGQRDDATGDYVDGTFRDEATVCEPQQHQTREDRNGRVVITSEWLALFRPSVTLTAHDEVTIPDVASPDGVGSRFAFEGDPVLVRKPSSQVATHWYVRLRKVG